MTLLPKELLEIRDFLIDYEFSLSKTTEDWRINASINEDEIVEILTKYFDISRPRARDWFDFSINDENWNFIPVNIKVSDTTHADNLNCKLGIYYSLTGEYPTFANEISWDKFLLNLKENLNDSNHDYYFLVINKKNLWDIILNSLKWLQKLTPNWNNLPFQCRWDENRECVSRTYEEIKTFLLTTFGSSIKKRANIFLTFNKLFNEYVQ